MDIYNGRVTIRGATLSHYIAWYKHPLYISSGLIYEMGRITIFSLGGCVHCNKVKALFGELGWNYCDIDLEQFPDAKQSMIKLTDRLTVPQVFFHPSLIPQNF